MPRASLTETRVLDERKRMAAEIGLSQLILAALAARFGGPQPSLYKHMDVMADRQRRLALRAKRLTRGFITALPTGPPNNRTRLAMTAYTGVNLR